MNSLNFAAHIENDATYIVGWQKIETILNEKKLNDVLGSLHDGLFLRALVLILLVHIPTVIDIPESLVYSVQQQLSQEHNLINIESDAL